jgi:hypothetical protein
VTQAKWCGQFFYSLSLLGEGWGEGLSANCNHNIAAGFSPQSVGLKPGEVFPSLPYYALSPTLSQMGEGVHASQPSEMKSTVDVNHFAGRKREGARGDSRSGAADIFRCAPALNGRQARVDQLIVFLFDVCGHVC